MLTTDANISIVSLYISILAVSISFLLFFIQYKNRRHLVMYDQSRILLDIMYKYTNIQNDLSLTRYQYKAYVELVKKNKHIGQMIDNSSCLSVTSDSLKLVHAIFPNDEKYTVDADSELIQLSRQHSDIINTMVVIICNKLETICVPLKFGLVNRFHFYDEFSRALVRNDEIVFENFIMITDIYPSMKAARAFIKSMNEVKRLNIVSSWPVLFYFRANKIQIK